MGAESKLARRLNLVTLTLYGVGTILGAGIYVLVGKVADRAGTAAPLSFLIAATVALLTGMSFAELAARYPRSAGEAAYVGAAFARRWLTTSVGLLVLVTGVVSAATIAVGFHGYLSVFVELPAWLAIGAAVFLLTLLASWGIAESVVIASIVTVAEICGLFLVLAVSGESLAEVPARLDQLFVPEGAAQLLGIGAGAFLAFYAFIGFEDMVNVAEEVKEPARTMPVAIFLALALASTLYLLVAAVAVTSLPVEELAASAKPLALVYERATGNKPVLIALISMFAVLNGALIQLIMGARVLYGLADMGRLPKALGAVNQRTRTPVLATTLIGALVLVLALFFPLTTLADLTSLVILVVFTVVNAALWKLHRRGRKPAEHYVAPAWAPPLALLACLSMLAFRLIYLIW